MHDLATPTDEQQRASAEDHPAEASPSVLDGARAFGVVLGPAIALDAAWAGGIVGTLRALRRRRRPGALSLALVGSAAAYVLVVRPWLQTWGATPEEQDLPLPGDDTAPDAAWQRTRAVTIDAPIDEVWPWLAQIGQDRGGFYSYAWLENLAGCRLRNAERIHPEWQHREVGDTILLHPASGLELRRFEPPRSLALAHGWYFALQELPDGRTRLYARSRRERGADAIAYRLFGEIPHFVMERKMLLGIKERAERATA